MQPLLITPHFNNNTLEDGAIIHKSIKHIAINGDSGDEELEICVTISSRNRNRNRTNTPTTVRRSAGAAAAAAASSLHVVISSSCGTYNHAYTLSSAVWNGVMDTSNGDHIACWAKFDLRKSSGKTRLGDANANANNGRLSKQNTTPVLCVLASTNLLYTIDLSGGQCDEISLPFEATGVFPGNNGVVLNRAINADDEVRPYSASTMAMTMPAAGKHNKTSNNTNIRGGGEASNVHQMITEPPRVARVFSPGAPLTSSSSNNNQATTTSNANGSKASGLQNVLEQVPSLFTLTDPLDEPHPVAITTSTSTSSLLLSEGGEKSASASNGGAESGVADNTLFLDAFERLLYISGGISSKVVLSKSTSAGAGNDEPVEAFLCVTYNLHLQRHALWWMKEAPPVPGPLPLSDMLPSATAGIGGNANGRKGRYHTAADAAVADFAFGDNTLDGSAWSFSDGRGRNQPHVGLSAADATSRSILFESSSGGLNYLAKERLDNIIVSPHNYPAVSFEMFWDEGRNISDDGTPPIQEMANLAQARQVFMASNLKGELTILCILCPIEDSACDDTIDPYVLRCLSLESKAISHVIDIPCLSAQPIQTTANGATDILVCSSTGSKCEDATPRLLLYRACHIITECAIYVSTMDYKSNQNRDQLEIWAMEATDRSSSNETAEKKFAKIVDISHAARNMVNVSYVMLNGEINVIRGSLSLVATSPLVEASLVALESSPNIPRELSRQIRTDCARLNQTISLANESYSDVDTHIDEGWSSLATILWSLFCETFELSDGCYRDAETMDLDQGEVESDWAILMGSEYHASYSAKSSSLFGFIHEQSLPNIDIDGWTWCKQALKHVGGIASSTMMNSPGIWPSIFDTLHLLFEDSKLLLSRFSWLRPLGRFLLSLSRCIADDQGCTSMDDFIDHYCKELGQERNTGHQLEQKRKTFNRSELTNFSRPPCINTYFSVLMTRDADIHLVQNYPCGINEAFKTSRQLCRFLAILFSDKMEIDNDGNNISRSAVDLILAMEEEGFSSPADLDVFPLGVSLPIREALYLCRNAPPEDWPPRAYSLIGREDLRYSQEAFSQVLRPASSPLTRYRCSNLDNMRVGNKVEKNERSKSKKSSFEDSSDFDGLALLEAYSSMLFPHDTRVRDASMMVRSSKPVFLRVDRPPEVSDHEYEKLKQVNLQMLCNRSLALSVGRGMMTVGTLHSSLAERLPIPKICLTGRVPPTNTIVSLDTTSASADMTIWPEFHNGVASGLRIGVENDDSQESAQITRTWILYNKPSTSSSHPIPQGRTSQTSKSGNTQHAHGGFLMALGLRGHLSKLAITDVFDYLTTGSVTTIVGVLLGMAANKRSTCDPATSKMLCLHVPSLLPLTFSQMETSSVIQSAAVAGIGILYQGSSHRLMTEFLLTEIGKRPTNDLSTQDRESYKLSCGLALGMVNLRKGGGSNDGLADLRIEERLHGYIVGGKEDEIQMRKEANERASSIGLSGDTEYCSRIAEYSLNTDITAPAATLALGLMYMKTGDRNIASRMDIPDTHFLLDYVRPDLLLLRVVARSLILWDAVLANDEWIEAQIPSVVKDSYSILGQQVGPSLTSLTGIEPMQVDVNLSGAKDTDENKKIPEADVETGNAKVETAERNVDRQAIRQIHAHLVAGACFSLGLRYAGTGDQKAARTLMRRIQVFQSMRDGHDPIMIARRPEKLLLEMCLSCSAISLALVMAGTGDVDALRLFRELRWKCNGDTRFGSHMAFGAAIGLLFLGGGTCTFGRGHEDIAALVMAFFPRYPIVTSDNQYHLQALRHFYVLAVKRREIEVIDVDTRDPIYIPIEVNFVDNHHPPLNLTAPCLVRNVGAVSQIKVASERYFPLTKKIDAENKHMSWGTFGCNFTVYVKKKSGFLSYVQDPHSIRSLLAQTGTSNISALELINSFTEDSRLLAFAQYFCDTQHQSPLHDLVLHKCSLAEMCTDILYECLVNEKPEAVVLYLSMMQSVSSIKKRADIRQTWDIRMILSYYASERAQTRDAATRLVSSNFLNSVRESIDRHLFAAEIEWKDAFRYSITGICPEIFRNPQQSMKLIYAFCVWYGIKAPFSDNGAQVLIDESACIS